MGSSAVEPALGRDGALAQIANSEAQSHLGISRQMAEPVSTMLLLDVPGRRDVLRAPPRRPALPESEHFRVRVLRSER